MLDSFAASWISADYKMESVYLQNILVTSSLQAHFIMSLTNKQQLLLVNDSQKASWDFWTFWHCKPDVTAFSSPKPQIIPNKGCGW